MRPYIQGNRTVLYMFGDIREAHNVQLHATFDRFTMFTEELFDSVTERMDKLA